MLQATGLFQISNYFLNWYAVPFLLASILTLFVGSYVLIHGGRRQLLSFALLCGVIFVWLLTTVLVYSCKDRKEAEVYIRFMYLGIAFIPPSLYLYVSVWLDQWKANRVKIYLGYVLSLIFFLSIFFTREIVDGVTRFFWGFHSHLTPLGIASFLPFFFGYVFFFFQTLYRGYCRTEDIQIKKQVRLVTFAFVIAFFATMDFFPCFGVPIFPTGGLILFLAFCVLSYTIIRYKLFDIETVMHMTVMWFATSAIAVLPFAGIIYSTQPIVKKLLPLQLSLYFLALAMVFYFYYRSLQPWLAQIFQRQRANLMGVLDRFSKELVHLKDLRDLLQSFARMLRRQLYVRRLSVFLFDEVKNEFVPTISKGIRNLKPFPASHPFFKWLETADAVTAAGLVATDPSVEKFKDEVADCFAKTQAFVAVPFVLGEKLIGVAFLGKKATLKRYNFGEIQFLTKLKAPVTIAFSNSVRYDSIHKLSEELQRWNEELERRVDERTRELVKTQEQLIQAEKLATLGTLAGGVAHEINNPLTAVLTNAQILKMTADSDVKESLDLIEEGAKRCQQIVQKLMKYARKTAEETPSKPVDLNQVVKSTLNLIGFQFRQENVEITTELGEIPPVPGIANELEQVLTNLLVNARDAVKAANVKGKIEVKTRRTGDSVELIVKDNGIGIAKENLKKIFDPFFTTKDVGSGTGLGLAVSFGILKRHHATISAESQPDQGATFMVRFPLPKAGA